MKILVTGASGFVGSALLTAAAARGHDVIALAHERSVPATASQAAVWITGFDLRNADAVLAIVQRTRPDAIVHLAAASSVRRSWQDAWSSIEVNLQGTANLLKSVTGAGAKIDLLLVGSAEAYGAAGTETDPLVEAMPLMPRNPYGGAKAAQEGLALGLRELLPGRLVLTRSFPHIGPGQAEHFVVPNWTRQLLDLRRAGGGTMRVGDTSVVRDIADVRDVAAAYLDLLESDADGVFNVCTGRGHRLADILEQLRALVGVDVTVEVDESRLRPTDIRSLVGAPAKLFAATGWTPAHDIGAALADIVAEAAREPE